MKKGVSLFLFLGVLFSLFPLVFAVSPVSVTVDFANQGGSCRADSNTSAWLNQNNQVVNYTVKNGFVQEVDCFLKDEATGDYLNISCCPSGWDVCSQYIGSREEKGGRCTERVELCTNILGMTSGPCESASQEVAERTLGVKEQFNSYVGVGGKICYSFFSAKCVWEDTNLTDGKDEKSCGASLVNITGINDTENGECRELQTLGTCIYQYANQEDNCDNDKQSITIWYNALAKNNTDGNFVEPSTLGMGWCQDKSQEYACSASIQLPGFSMFNLLVSILGIGMVYFLFKKNFKGSI